MCACASWCGAANKFVQHNLVSDLPGMADHLDACLVNPWGIAATATSPFWVSLNGSGLAGIYDGNGNPNTLLVNVPGPAGATAPGGQCRSTTLGPGAASGMIVNDTTAFPVGGTPASFMFSSEQGVIVGWNGAAGKTGAIMADRSAAGAVYKGLATATRSEGPLLYAADFGNGKVDVFDGQMKLLSLPGAFTDPMIPAGFAPFNIANLGGSLYVSYAKQNAEHHDDVAGAGNGYVDVYDLNGVLLQRLVSAGPLNSPWGMTIAPTGFGDFGGSSPGRQFWRRRDQRFRPDERKVPRRAAGWEPVRRFTSPACGGSPSETGAAPIPAPHLPAAMPIRSTLRPGSPGRIRWSRMGCWGAFNPLPRLPATAWSIPRVSCRRSRRERSQRSSALGSQQRPAVGPRPNWRTANCRFNVSFPQGCMKSARHSW